MHPAEGPVFHARAGAALLMWALLTWHRLSKNGCVSTCGVVQKVLIQLYSHASAVHCFILTQLCRMRAQRAPNPQPRAGSKALEYRHCMLHQRVPNIITSGRPNALLLSALLKRSRPPHPPQERRSQCSPRTSGAAGWRRQAAAARRYRRSPWWPPAGAPQCPP